MSAVTTTKPRVLFLDDEPSVTAAFRTLLRRAPYEVVIANTAVAALAVLAQNPPIDVVISDMDMPDMSGAEFLARVRTEYPKTTRVVLSGRAKLEDTIHAINTAAVFRFLVKPCPPADITRCIEDALAARKLRKSTTPPPLADEAAYANCIETLWVAVQPIVSVRERRIVAYEALVRSREASLPHGGAIIELAERLGRVREIERHIRRRAAEIVTRLPEGTQLLVNLHPSALDDPELIADDAILSRDPSRVTFEITERARLKPEGAAWDAIRALRNRGHKVAIDDLGAGYAGLTSLVTLQPDIVKLDMELIRNVDTSPTRSKLVASLAALSKQLDVRVIAEGVESMAECQHLITLGCDWMQGYFFARPGIAFPTVSWPTELAA